MSERALTGEQVTSKEVEIQRIMRTGVTWTASGAVVAMLALGPLLASGWRPTELPMLGAVTWWVGAVVAAAGLALLLWAGCPVLAYTLEDAYTQKVFCIRVGIVLNLSGMAVAGFAVLLSPAAVGG